MDLDGPSCRIPRGISGASSLEDPEALDELPKDFFLRRPSIYGNFWINLYRELSPGACVAKPPQAVKPAAAPLAFLFILQAFRASHLDDLAALRSGPRLRLRHEREQALEIDGNGIGLRVNPETDHSVGGRGGQ